MAANEKKIIAALQLGASAKGHRLFRNHVEQFALPGGGYRRSGLGPGSPDLVGLTKSGRFVGIEVKSSHKQKLSQQQELWIEMLNDRGAVGLVCIGMDQVEECLQALERAEP